MRVVEGLRGSMGESPQSSPVDTRDKPPTPPGLPQVIEEPGIDLGAFFLSFLLWQRLDAKSNDGVGGLRRLRPTRAGMLQRQPLPR